MRSIEDMPVTQWFGRGVEPERIGVYESGTYELRGGQIVGGLFQFWNGKFWGMVEDSVKDAYRHRNYRSSFQEEYWRGLVSKP